MIGAVFHWRLFCLFFVIDVKSVVSLQLAKDSCNIQKVVPSISWVFDRMSGLMSGSVTTPGRAASNSPRVVRENVTMGEMLETVVRESNRFSPLSWLAG